MDKKSKQSEGSSFGQIVAREVLSQAQAMDARDTMRYVVPVSSSRTVSVFKMTQTGSGVTYVVERTRDAGASHLTPSLSVAFDDAKIAVRCFATTVLAEQRANSYNGANWEPVDVCAVPPGSDVTDGMPVLAFCPKMIELQAYGGPASSKEVIATCAQFPALESKFAARLDELAGLLDSKVRGVTTTTASQD